MSECASVVLGFVEARTLQHFIRHFTEYFNDKLDMYDLIQNKAQFICSVLSKVCNLLPCQTIYKTTRKTAVALNLQKKPKN